MFKYLSEWIVGRSNFTPGRPEDFADDRDIRKWELGRRRLLPVIPSVGGYGDNP